MKYLKLFFILFIFNNYFLYAKDLKNILILNSYHKGFLYSDNIINGIENTLNESKDIDTTILYMDSNRVKIDNYDNVLLDFYTKKLKHIDIDLVICIDKFAYNFTRNNKHNLFKNIPIVYAGTQKPKVTDNNIYTLSAIADIKENIQFIYSVMKKLKKLYIIDTSLEEDKSNLEVEKALKNLKKRFEIVYIEHTNIEKLKNEFNHFKKNQAIFLINLLKDDSKNIISSTHVYDFIKNAHLPIFVSNDLYLKKGVVGGKLVSIYNLGEKTAQLAKNILDNKKPKKHNNLKYNHEFDSIILRKYNIKPYYFYNSYKIVNKPQDFFEKNKDLFEILFLLFPLLLLLVVGLLHNIHYRKQTEKLLKERIDFDETLLNTIKNPIFWQNKDEQIVDFNNKFSSMLALPEEKLYYSTLKKLRSYPRVKKLLEALESYNNKGRKNIFFTIEVEDNKKKIYLVNQAKFKDEKSQSYGTVTILTDVTKERQIEKEKERNQEFLIQQSKLAEIGEIFSAIAHQWKAPLLEITTIAQESFYSSEDDDKERESYVKDIMTQVKYMNDTINDFQEFIKPSNKKSTFDIYEAITSLLKIIDHTIRFNYIDITIDLKDNTNVMVNGYRNEFMQSLLNIINNAKDELIKNDFKNRKINIEIFNKQNSLYVNIKDNAGGISTKNIHTIFTPYYSTKKHGSGIGLYMTKVIIEDKMNGKIRVKNTKIGACFTIILEQNR
ncbi:ABC transporter substrate binding protein [Arcobacter sp. CECT 8985]|uniref:sensor histidine kinase n=1 Tax=Arcobacter sp. CECT 8985 TaxID=1935424 RepID=UPI00100BED64|nr:ABC transporter substrate binding protein [Arcobacter sp. CECT 8985]RXJ85229.1 hypothetical protein CRU93_11680 [Arcobacter sp. CECT 8985]